MDEEFKKKASEALNAGADAARKIGGVVRDLGKKGYAAAMEKAKDLREKAREAKEKADAQRAEEQRQWEADQAREMERLAAERQRKASRCAVLQGPSSRRSPRWQGDPEDKELILSYGWLYFLWWFWNIVYTILCIWWFLVKMSSNYTKDTAWVPLVVWLILLFFNRLAYEGAVAFFEMVKHLRQIRDELRRHNMREEEKDRAAQEARQRADAPAEEVPQDADESATSF